MIWGVGFCRSGFLIYIYICIPPLQFGAGVFSYLICLCLSIGVLEDGLVGYRSFSFFFLFPLDFG